ncbi:MAG: MTH938/NDUFAF3 family protein [bacterium]|nr:MTH938/NDUFAF3 family protein [bacterium]
MIEDYNFGQIKIDGKTYSHDVRIFRDGVKSWWRVTGHRVVTRDIEEILKEKPEVVIFGTGAYGIVDVSQEVKDLLQKRGIRVIIEKTDKAVKEFNDLSKNKDVIAALHLTC